MAAESAQVETLTAEVRTLMVGRRQITLSVYRQLDIAFEDYVEPFGRVNDPKTAWDGPLQSHNHISLGPVWVVGRSTCDGSLVRACRYVYDLHVSWGASDDEKAAVEERVTRRRLAMEEWEALPLIVLAGMR